MDFFRINDRTTSTKGVEFSSVELWGFMTFLLRQKKTPEEIHEHMLLHMSDERALYSTVKKWLANFQHGDSEIKEAARSRKFSAVSTNKTAHDVTVAD